MPISTTCPSNGFNPTDNYVLKGDCTIPGAFELIGNGSLALSNGILTIYGNLVLMNNAYVSIFNGGINFPQTGYSQYGIYMQNNAIFDLNNSTFVTNNGTDDNYSMAINVYNEGLVYFNQSTLNAGNSWLLGNFFQNSKLVVSESTDLPTEMYPSDSSQLFIERSSFAGLWLNFLSGSAATIEVPSLNVQGVFSFTFGGTPGFDYYVNLVDSLCRLSLNSYPNSTMILTNSQENIENPSKQVGLCFGYYFQSPMTSDVIVGNFTVGNNITESFTDSNRLIQLENINLNPFSWQFYASYTLPYTVTITNSLINEVGCFQNASMIIKDSVFQLAVLEAYGPFAYITVNNSQIWSQAIQSFGEGIISITSSEIHGNFVQVGGVGSVLNFSVNTFDGHNGNATITNCNPNSQGYPPNVNGVPLCNPYTPLHGCANIVVSDGGELSRSPPCGAYPTMAPSQIPSLSTLTPTWSPSFAPSRVPTANVTVMPTGGGGGGGNSAALSDGEIAGVAVGSAIGLVLVLIAVIYLLSFIGINISLPWSSSGKGLEESGQVKLNNLPKSDQI